MKLDFQKDVISVITVHCGEKNFRHKDFHGNAAVHSRFIWRSETTVCYINLRLNRTCVLVEKELKREHFLFGCRQQILKQVLKSFSITKEPFMNL